MRFLQLALPVSIIYLTHSAIVKRSKEDEIITDEDVADDESENNSTLRAPYKDGNHTVIPITKEAAIELNSHWVHQGLSGLMAAHATRKLKKVSKRHQEEHEKCTSKAKTITEHAKCVVQLLDVYHKTKQKMKKYGKTGQRSKKQKKNRRRSTTTTSTPTTTTTTTTSTPAAVPSTESPIARVFESIYNPHHFHAVRSEWDAAREKAEADLAESRRNELAMLRELGRDIPSDMTLRALRRMKRDLNSDGSPALGSFSKMIEWTHEKMNSLLDGGKLPKYTKNPNVIHRVSRNNYSLPEDSGRMTSFADLARSLTHTIKSAKNKPVDDKTWQDTIDDIKTESMKLKKRKEIRKALQRNTDKMLQQARLHNLDLFASQDINPLGNIDGFSEKDELVRYAREKEKHLSPEEKARLAPVQLLREGVKIGLTAMGADTAGFENKTIKMVSPRFMSIVPEDDEDGTINLLSPSLLSLHNQGKGIEDMLSLQKMAAFFQNQDQQEMLDFVIEASGVSDAVSYIKDVKLEEAKKKMDDEEGIGARNLMQFDEVEKKHGTFERRKLEVHDHVRKTFTPQQIHQMNTTGYALLTPEQLEVVYGEQSPFNNTEKLEMFKNVTQEDVEAQIEMIAMHLAAESAKFEHRAHDIVLTLVTLFPIIRDPVTASQPIILSPIILAALIESPSIYGSVILSPWVFVPVIVSPRILGPVVLSPIVFAPVILSPLVMVPVILSPGVGVPFVLSPFVLCPFILSPQAMTPLILSPFVLSPFIGTPNVLSPIILSPFVLSPLIFSPAAVSALVLSPHALSPAVGSQATIFTAALSPSWLS